jgi:hypothetical protein
MYILRVIRASSGASVCAVRTGKQHGIWVNQ